MISLYWLGDLVSYDFAELRIAHGVIVCEAITEGKKEKNKIGGS